MQRINLHHEDQPLKQPCPKMHHGLPRYFHFSIFPASRHSVFEQLLTVVGVGKFGYLIMWDGGSSIFEISHVSILMLEKNHFYQSPTGAIFDLDIE
jgi:hypothetical protein